MLDGSDGAIHEDGIADGLCVGGGIVVVVEDSAAVLVDDLDLVPSRAQALGGVDYPGAHAEHGMEQGDLGHRSLLTSGDVRPQWRERTRAREALRVLIVYTIGSRPSPCGRRSCPATARAAV